MKPLFIVDIDGTVCESLDLVKRLSAKFHNHVDCWDDSQVKSFFEQVSKRRIVFGAEVLKVMLLQGACDIIFLTGRSERVGKAQHIGRRITQKWLVDKLGMPKDIQLYMRPPGDMRPPNVIKFDVFEKQVFSANSDRTFVFLDDDIKVLTKYAKYGIALKAPECWGAFSHFLPG